MTGGRPTVYALVRNRTHVEMLHPTILALEARGYSCGYYIFPALVGAERAREALDEIGRKYDLANRAEKRAQAGDLIVYGLQSKWRNRIGPLLVRGVHVAHVVEGCRFMRAFRYHPDVPVFGWGASIQEFMPDRVTVVGSPVIDAMRGPAVPRENIAVINYKFRVEDDEKDLNGDWARAAASACIANGITPVFSGHPSNENLPKGFEVSREPIAALLPRAKLLISRASTVIYQALAAGTQPFYFGIPDELLLEFEDPMGSFPVANDAQTLTDQIAAWCAGEVYDQSRFLDRHVDFDPDRSASLRLADALEKLCQGGE